MDYFVASNLSHDGKAYERGDRISLAEDIARPLIEAGVIQSDPIEQQPEAPEAIAEPEQAASANTAQVGGEESSSGEPSLDGEKPETADKAVDVTPGVETSPPEPVEPPPTAQEPEAAAAPRRGQPKAAETATEPENDPSANL